MSKKQKGKLYEFATYTKIFHQNHLLQVLDEAKAEFTELTENSFGRDIGIEIKSVTVLQWFEKWFGEL